MWQRLKNLFSSEFSHLELSNSLRTFGISLVTVFIPVSLYQRGFSIDHIIVFYLALYTTWILSLPAVMGLYHYIGIKKTMSYSALILIGYIVSIQFISSVELLYVSAVLGGLGKALYWLGFYTEFNKTSHDQEVEHVSIDRLISTGLEAGSTFIAGLIIGIFSPIALYIVSSVFFIASFFILRLDPDDYPRREFKLDTFKKVFFCKKNYSSLWGFVVDGMEVLALAVIWPLYIFIETENFVLTGGIMLASFIVSSVLISAVSHWKQYLSELLHIGAFLDAAGWIAKGLVSGNVLFAFTQTAHDLTRSFFNTSYTGQVQLNASHDGHRYHYFLLHEIGKASGKIIILSTLLALPNIESIFFVLAGMTWVYLLL